MMTLRQRADRFRVAWKRANDALGPATRLIVPLSVLAVLNGLAEAGVLALIAQAAFAMSTGDDSASIDIGPFGLSGSIPTLLAIAFGLAVVRVLAQWALAFLTATMSSQTQARLQARLFTAYSTAAWSVQSREREGHLQELITAHARRAMQAAMIAAGVLPPLFAFAILVSSAFVINPLIALTVAATAIVLFLALRPFGRRTRAHSTKQSRASLFLAESTGEAVRLSEDNQVYGTAAEQRSLVDDRIEELRRPFFRSQLLTMGVPALYQGLALVLVIVGLAVLHGVGAENLGSLGAIVLMLVRALAYGQQLQSAYQKLNDVTPFLNRMSAQIEVYEGNQTPTGTQPMPPLAGLAFDRVAFRYEPDEAVLDDLTFTVAAGETIGIVGPSGAGKSTLVQILLRLREPDAGTFLVNSVDATTIDRSQWQRRVAFVSQESRLLAGTVAENIRFHRPWISDADVVRAARQAHIHDEIMAWAGGYDHRVGQRLDAVSGGQRQRICLARALAGNPDLLVLDEPTSALDTRSETAIQASLEEMHGRLTLFIIAHRLTTLRACDRIMVVVGGRIEAFDTPDNLRARGGYYQATLELAELGTSGE